MGQRGPLGRRRAGFLRSSMVARKVGHARGRGYEDVTGLSGNEPVGLHQLLYGDGNSIIYHLRSRALLKK